MVERIKRIKEEIVGVLSVLGSLYLFLSLFSHYSRDPVPFFRSTEPQGPLQNLGGTIGAYTSGWLIIFLGLAAFLIPLFITAYGIKRLLGKEGHRIYLLGSILFILSSCIFLSLFSLTFQTVSVASWVRRSLILQTSYCLFPVPISFHSPPSFLLSYS
jgi:phosphoglycerol transferase MdoB-like AlkP superfamily enzyme